MRAFITKGGIHTWINTRENKFIEQHFNDKTLLEQEELSDRDKYIAQTLVGRGILVKKVREGAIKYTLNTNKMVS